MLVQIDRNAVAAADDLKAHGEQRTVDDSKPLKDFVAELIREHYLPPIHGGQSCWILRKSQSDTPIGVIGVQNNTFACLRLLPGQGYRLSVVGNSLFFEYAAQEDPDFVFARLLRAH